MVSFAEFGGMDGWFWIGLKWELDWKWAHSLTDVNFTFWGQGFPNWEGRLVCGSIKFGKAENGHWENVDCGITLQVLCEKRLSFAISTIESTYC